MFTRRLFRRHALVLPFSHRHGATDWCSRRVATGFAVAGFLVFIIVLGRSAVCGETNPLGCWRDTIFGQDLFVAPSPAPVTKRQGANVIISHESWTTKTILVSGNGEREIAFIACAVGLAKRPFPLRRLTFGQQRALWSDVQSCVPFSSSLSSWRRSQ